MKWLAKCHELLVGFSNYRIVADLIMQIVRDISIFFRDKQAADNG